MVHPAEPKKMERARQGIELTVRLLAGKMARALRSRIIDTSPWVAEYEKKPWSLEARTIRAYCIIVEYYKGQSSKKNNIQLEKEIEVLRREDEERHEGECAFLQFLRLHPKGQIIR